MRQVARPAQFGVQHLVCDRCHTLFLKGELDLAAADYLEAVVFCLLGEGIDGISLNLSKLRFIDATGLRAILAVRELCEHRGFTFSMTRPSGQVQRLFDVTGAADQLPIDRDHSGSLAAERRIRPLRGLSVARQ
ncbi:MAG: anti-sigma factor antagonist [Solirubrobacterales bacterium]|nr:anti-sigma factor antagonist [Solirubrobacterales bacterium]